jgi:predicted O-methyltransferase YrrM
MLPPIHQPPPTILSKIEADTQAIGFTMASDPLTGALLRTLAASKCAGRLLELGTGPGMGTAWLLDGMDARATLLTVDTDQPAVAVAQGHLGSDPRVTFTVDDGGAVIEGLRRAGKTFDLVFADTWPGKFYLLDEALGLLAGGGLYIIDDLLPQANWPEGHGEKVADLISRLYQRPDLRITALEWSTGLIIATKTAERE